MAGVSHLGFTGAYFLGRLGFYSGYAFAGRAIGQASLGETTREAVTSPVGTGVQVLVIAVLVAFIRFDWGKVGLQATVAVRRESGFRNQVSAELHAVRRAEADVCLPGISDVPAERLLSTKADLATLSHRNCVGAPNRILASSWK